MRRRGTIYEGSIQSYNDAFVGIRDEALDTVPSDIVSAYYTDYDTGGGVGKLIQVSVPVQPEYTFTGQRTASSNVSGTETPLFTIPSGARRAGKPRPPRTDAGNARRRRRSSDRGG